MKSLRILSRKKHKTRMSVYLNILCLICTNFHYMWNYAEFDKTHRFYSIFNSNYSENNGNDNLYIKLVKTTFNISLFNS